MVGSCSYTLYWLPWYQTWVVPLRSLCLEMFGVTPSPSPKFFITAGKVKTRFLCSMTCPERLETRNQWNLPVSTIHIQVFPIALNLFSLDISYTNTYTRIPIVSYTAISHSSLMHIGDIHRDIISYSLCLPGFCCNIYLSPKQARYRNGLVLLSASSNVRYPKGVYLRSAAEAEISCFSLPW